VVLPAVASQIAEQMRHVPGAVEGWARELSGCGHNQQAVLLTERTAARISGQHMLDTVVLIKALGDGWTRS
jgi:hypothetical protein